MNVQKSSDRGKGKKMYLSASQFGSLWFISWAPISTEESEGRALQTMKQAAKLCSPDCCGITLNFLLFAEKRAILLGLGDQLLTQQQIFNMLSKILVNLCLLLSSYNSKVGILFTYLHVQKTKFSEAKNFKNVTLSFWCMICIFHYTQSISVTRNFH